jgi:predicted nucleotidyltransferase
MAAGHGLQITEGDCRIALKQYAIRCDGAEWTVHSLSRERSAAARSVTYRGVRFGSTGRCRRKNLRVEGVRQPEIGGSQGLGAGLTESDIDVLVDLDENQPMDILEYARLKLYINELLGGPSDVVNRQTLKPFLRANILHDTIHAF